MESLLNNKILIAIISLMMLLSCESKKIGLYNVEKDESIQDLLDNGYKLSDFIVDASKDNRQYYLQLGNKVSTLIVEPNDEILFHYVLIDLEPYDKPLLNKITSDSMISIDGNKFKCHIVTHKKRNKRVLSFSRKW